MLKQFTEEDIKKIIPKEFQTKTKTKVIKLVEDVDASEYKLGELLGCMNDIKDDFQIGIYTNYYKNGVVSERVKLSPDVIIETYFHELFHHFQEYCGKGYNEQDANLFSHFMLEYEKTKVYHD